MSDVPTGLQFVDPTVVETTYRFCLWAAPGEGKTVAAASAPRPILVLSADRPSAYAFARRLHGHTATSLREARYTGEGSLAEVYRYLGSPEGADIRTVVVDPVSNIYDALVEVAPKRADGDLDYQWVNKKLLGFITSLRRFDVHVVLVAHEKLNDGKKGDGKLYPRIGGGTLISKALAEMDVVAHIERTEPADGAEPVWFAQIQPARNLVGKDGTNALGARRVADLSRWVELMREYTAAPAADDLPWDSDPAGASAPNESATGQAGDAPTAATPGRDSDGTDADAPVSDVVVDPGRLDTPADGAAREVALPTPEQVDAAEADLAEQIAAEFDGTIERPGEYGLSFDLEALLDQLMQGRGLTAAGSTLGFNQTRIKELMKEAGRTFDERPTVAGVLLGWERWKQEHGAGVEEVAA